MARNFQHNNEMYKFNTDIKVWEITSQNLLRKNSLRCTEKSSAEKKKSNNDVISAYWKRKNKEKSHGKVINKAKNTYIYKYSQPAKERKTKKDIKSKWMANG